MMEGDTSVFDMVQHVKEGPAGGDETVVKYLARIKQKLKAPAVEM